MITITIFEYEYSNGVSISAERGNELLFDFKLEFNSNAPSYTIEFYRVVHDPSINRYYTEQQYIVDSRCMAFPDDDYEHENYIENFIDIIIHNMNIIFDMLEYIIDDDVEIILANIK